jgi:type IV secretory pathway VirD2 relaxase
MARLKAVGDGPGGSGQLWSQGVRALAQARWGDGLSTSQRVILKAHVARHTGGAGSASKVMAAYVKYLARGGTGLEGEAETFYGARIDDTSAREHVKEWAADRHHFRFIVSAEHGDRIDDLKALYARNHAARGN